MSTGSTPLQSSSLIASQPNKSKEDEAPLLITPHNTSEQQQNILKEIEDYEFIQQHQSLDQGLRQRNIVRKHHRSTLNPNSSVNDSSFVDFESDTDLQKTSFGKKDERSREQLLKLAQRLPEKRLRLALDIMTQLQDNDLDQLLQMHTAQGINGVKEFFFRKGIDELQLPDDHPVQNVFGQTRTGANPIFSQGAKVSTLFNMPSLDQVRHMVKKSGRNTLKEVEQATIEKLSNKILRAFTYDMFIMLVPSLIIALEWRQASRVNEDKKLLMWFCYYFGTMFFFAFVRLTRVPVLNYTRMYFFFTIITTVGYYLALFGIFVWGNVLFWGEITNNNRFNLDWQTEQIYDHRILWIIMAVILVVNWVAIILAVHFILFFSTLYFFWNSISQMVLKIASDLSPRALMESVVEVMGEGEMQDSIVIGFLQYFISTNNYFCRICQSQFKLKPALEMKNEQDESFNSSQQSVCTDKIALEEDVVQIGCNPAHYFHSNCLQKTNQCPVCHY